MTDRHIPGTCPAADPRVGPAAAPEHRSLWQRLCGNASPAHQRELLALARQGVLYTHLVPPTRNGVSTDPGQQFLASLLDEARESLDPVRPQPLDPIDAALDETQRDAVARALATPDICLIQGLPGTGKSRSLVELLLQAARRGERTLLTAASSAALDCLLEQVAGHDSIFAIRCLDQAERAESLPAVIRALTFEGRLANLQQEGLRSLQRDLEALRSALQATRDRLDLLQRSREALEQWRQAERQVAALRQEQAAVEDQVAQAALAAESSGGDDELARALLPHRQTHGQLQARIAAALAQIRQRQADATQALERLHAERAPFAALAAARRSGRWWTAAWWRSLFARGARARLASLDADCQRWESERAGLADEERRLLQEQAQGDEHYQAARRSCCAAEAARRRAILGARLAELISQERQARERWEAVRGTLDPCPQAVQAAIDCSEREQRQLEDQVAFAGEWIDCLSRQGASLAGWLAASANLVAVPLAALGRDSHFAACSFDRAVVEDAQWLAEADLTKVARRARRIVLVGDADPDAEPVERQKLEREANSRLPAAALFHRLWQRLHCDPRRLPYAWLTEEGRLCCRLRPVAAEQRPHLECERVADFPDIELRILTLPRSAPALAELVFPPAMSIGQAKEYIYRELQELPVHAQGHSFRWLEEPDRLVLRLSDAPVANPLAVPLEPGIREMVGVASPLSNGSNGSAPLGPTCCIEFDRKAGWDRGRAEEWVRQHLGVRELGRTIRLDFPYRMRPELATLVADLLYGGGYRLGSAAAGNGAGVCVEFVAVPPAAPTAKPEGRKIAAPGRRRLARSGAGLELDLADPRQRSRLPEALRGNLPSGGIVNYYEAQAVVRKLEALARQNRLDGQARIGVQALYPAQVGLIQSLAQQSPVLASAMLPLDFGTPESFRHREMTVALVSLTRSHTNRAVSFGDGPAQLALALTRARQQLILFGDPGTLARRCQWDKAVDHLDEPAAARERAVVSRLCDYLQGKGVHAQAFHLDEGIGP